MFEYRMQLKSSSGIDSCAVKVVPEKRIIKLGETYSGNIFLAGFKVMKVPTIIKANTFDTITYELKGDIDTILYNRGDTKFSFIPKTKGHNSFCISYQLSWNDGRISNFIEKFEYDVE